MNIERVVFSKRYVSPVQLWVIDWYYSDHEPYSEIDRLPYAFEAVKETLVRLGWVQSYDDKSQSYTLTPPLDIAPSESAHTHRAERTL